LAKKKLNINRIVFAGIGVFVLIVVIVPVMFEVLGGNNP